MVRLKSGNLVAIDAVVAIVRENENWHIRLVNGQTFVIESEDLNLFDQKSGKDGSKV